MCLEAGSLVTHSIPPLHVWYRSKYLPHSNTSFDTFDALFLSTAQQGPVLLLSRWEQHLPACQLGADVDAHGGSDCATRALL